MKGSTQAKVSTVDDLVYDKMLLTGDLIQAALKDFTINMTWINTGSKFEGPYVKDTDAAKLLAKQG